ncbi:3-methyl-2-oxobutanoate dehydrogenase subunit VorB [Coprothermobacter platensis]|uniref:3-methyl-2-oxobutanoate dehydrogenase subunit VorB n=1 Tax=Coprothermobacter platensis TaxID=108819 RepID=UPI0003811D3F|nr:3-methyl-2-oxobutanoate dehydrogenase subunit VorB [Coprothermobacter platensis]
MSDRILMKGNEAVGEAAVRSGCRLYFGYPITPASEIAEYMAYRLPQVNGTFIQAESELAASNMLYGAAAAGKYAMTASSSPGISLMQEAISYMAGAEVPALIVDAMRGGPGLGDIQAAQSDYFQLTKGGGHGDYHVIVFSPYTIQEVINIMPLAFQTAFRYRNPVVVAVDGLIGQMMEAVEFNYFTDPEEIPLPDWSLSGKFRHGNKKNVNTSLELDPDKLEAINWRLQGKYHEIEEKESRYDYVGVDNPETLVVAYGTVARLTISAVKKVLGEGKSIGLFRPVTLWPFPKAALAQKAKSAKRIVVLEMSAGQLIEDVKLYVYDPTKQYEFHGHPGGTTFTPSEIEQILRG